MKQKNVSKLNKEPQWHIKVEFVFQKINELDVEELTVISKKNKKNKLALTIVDCIKSSRSLILKIITRHLSSEEMDFPEGRAILTI